MNSTKKTKKKKKKERNKENRLNEVVYREYWKMRFDHQDSIGYVGNYVDISLKIFFGMNLFT